MRGSLGIKWKTEQLRPLCVFPWPGSGAIQCGTTPNATSKGFRVFDAEPLKPRQVQALRR